MTKEIDRQQRRRRRRARAVGRKSRQLAREVEAQRELVLAEVHARGRLRRAAHRERDGRGVEQRRAAGREALDAVRPREPEPRRRQPGALREIVVDPVELGGAAEERELGPSRRRRSAARRRRACARPRAPGVSSTAALRGGASARPTAEDALLALGALGVARARAARSLASASVSAAPATGTLRAATALPSTSRQKVVLRCPRSTSSRVPGRSKAAVEVPEHEALGFEHARLAAGRAQRLDQLRHLGARRDRRHHLGAALVAAHDRPVDHHLLEVERDVSLHLERHRLVELAAVGEGEGEAARGDAIRAQRGDHVRGRELVELHEAADHLRQRDLVADARQRRGAARRRRRGSVCWSSTALMLWLPRSSPSTFFSIGIGVPPHRIRQDSSAGSAGDVRSTTATTVRARPRRSPRR